MKSNHDFTAFQGGSVVFHNCYSIPTNVSFELNVKWQNIVYSITWLLFLFVILTQLYYPFYAKYITPQQIAFTLGINLSLLSFHIFGWSTLYLLRNDLVPENNRLKLLDGTVLNRGKTFIHRFEPVGSWYPYVQTIQIMVPVVAGIIIYQYYLSFDRLVFLIITISYQVLMQLLIWFRYLRKPTPDGVIVQIQPAEEVADEFAYSSGYQLTICRGRKKQVCVVDLPVLDPSMISMKQYGNLLTSRFTLVIIPPATKSSNCDHLLNDTGDIMMYASNQESEIQRYQQFLHEWIDPLMTHRMLTR